MSNVTDDAKAIRIAFKSAGIKASVRARRYSMGSSIDVYVKSGDFAEAKKIAGSFQDVSYDDYSGEILSGGNRFVHVEIAQEWIDEVAAPIADKVKAAYEAAKSVPCNRHVNVEGLPFSFANDGSPNHIALWGETRHLMSCVWDADAAVEVVARTIIRGAA